MGHHLTIKGQDGAFEAYIARPAALPAPTDCARADPAYGAGVAAALGLMNLREG